MTQEQEINELNSTVKVRIASSSVHGVGVFTIIDIKKGEKLHCMPTSIARKFYKIPWGSRNKLFPEVRDLIIGQWASWVNGSHFWSPNDTAVPIFFMNHSSDKEKINYDKLTDCASKDILKGEEVFEDYRVMDNWEQVFPWIKL